MKQISSSMLKALNSSSPRYVKKFVLYRRIWEESSGKYVPGPAEDITKYVIETGAIKWKLDNEGYGVWNNAGLSLTLSAGAGFFGEGEASSLYGAGIDVFAGVKTEEGDGFLKIFRGFILREPSFNFEERSWIIYLSGELARLGCFGAAELSTVKEEVLLSSRAADSASAEDADYLEFALPDKAVGEVLDLRCGLIEGGFESAGTLKAVNDYEASSLNSYKYPAKITLSSALKPGFALWVSYRVWHTDKSIEWILENTLKLCGDPERYIENVNYEGKIEAFFDQPSDADFLQGSHDFAEVSSGAVTLPSSFLKDASYDWEVIAQTNLPFELTPNSVGIKDGQLTVPGMVAAPCVQAYGTWEVECTMLWNETIAQYFYYVWQGEPLNGNGYCFQHTKYDHFRLFFAFFKVTGSTYEQLNVVWIDRDNQTYRVRYRICRYEDGSVRFMVKPLTPVEGPWHDFGIVCSDNTYKTSDYHRIIMTDYGNNHFYSIKLSPQAATGSGDYAPYANYYSPVIDGGARLCSWKNFTASADEGGGSCAYYARSKAAEASAWGDWNPVEPGSAIGESGRYLQLKWAGKSDAAQTSAPKLTNWRAEWEAEGVNIAMINASSMTCLDVVRELARLSGYQIGFDSEGTFFFKQRPALSEPAFKLTGNEIINIESVSGGADKLYNRVRVNFGNYTCTVDDFTLGAPRPNLIDKYGLKELSLSSGALLPAQNANLARACAPGIYKEAGKIKKRAAVVCRFLPQIELGDVAQVDFAPYLSGNMMVEGLEFNLSDWTLRLDLCSWEA